MNLCIPIYKVIYFLLEEIKVEIPHDSNAIHVMIVGGIMAIPQRLVEHHRHEVQ